MPEHGTIVRRTDGNNAENYARVISFSVHLYRAAGDGKYLKLTDRIGQETIEILVANGLFKGHPVEPYFESTDGVGLLLLALLELDAPGINLGGAF